MENSNKQIEKAKEVLKEISGKTKEEIEKNNKIDTEEAKYINDYTFDIVVTGTQVRPQD